MRTRQKTPFHTNNMKYDEEDMELICVYAGFASVKLLNDGVYATDVQRIAKMSFDLAESLVAEKHARYSNEPIIKHEQSANNQRNNQQQTLDSSTRKSESKDNDSSVSSEQR